MKKKMWAGLVLLVVLMILTGCVREGNSDGDVSKMDSGTDAGYVQETEPGAEEAEEGVMDAVLSRPNSSPEGMVQHLSIVTNTEKIDDFQACAEEIIKHSIANDFKTVMFSYDLSGYPIELHATVYLTEEDMTNGRPVFEMDYEQDKEGDVRYNIKDNPEKFHLTIKCSTCGTYINE